jgi:Fe-S-cluster containining protein
VSAWGQDRRKQRDAFLDGSAPMLYSVRYVGTEWEPNITGTRKMAKKSQCDKCTGLCCRYFALPIETPETRQDYDDIRWYLCHENITVFVEDGDWYINIKNKCRHLSEKNYRCKIYDKRPRICRQYRHADCDFVEGEYDFELHFVNDKQMEEYIKIKFDNNVTEKHKAKKKGKQKKKK